MDFDALKLAALVAILTMLLGRFGKLFRNNVAGAFLRLFHLYGAALLQPPMHLPHAPPSPPHAEMHHSHRRHRSLEGGGGSRARSEVFQELGLGAE